MKKLAFLLLIMVFSVLTNVSAQTYQMLWKQVEEAQKKDLPQTAIRQLKPIREKARMAIFCVQHSCKPNCKLK